MLSGSRLKDSVYADEIAEINVVPLVDVLLVLLVIFMITAPVAAYSLQVQLPKADISSVAAKSERLVVSVSRTGVVAVATEKMGKLSELTARSKFRSYVRRWRIRNPEGAALLRADERLAYGTVAKVMAELRRLKIERVGLVIEQP